MSVDFITSNLIGDVGEGIEPESQEIPFGQGVVSRLCVPAELFAGRVSGLDERPDIKDFGDRLLGIWMARRNSPSPHPPNISTKIPLTFSAPFSLK